MNETMEIHFDGACDNVRNKEMGIGVVAYLEGKEVISIHKYKGRGSSNKAEYLALIAALELCLERLINAPATDFIVRGDSQLIVNQVNGVYKVRNPDLHLFWIRVKKLLYGIPKHQFTLEWVPRDLNKRADELSKQALKHI